MAAVRSIVEEQLGVQAHELAPTDVSAAVVLAAGQGVRLGGRAKPLTRVAGRTLLERVIRSLREAGIARTIVVLGHAKDDVIRFVEEHELEVELVVNDDYVTGNASSVLVGARRAGGRFVLTMGDQVVEPAAVGQIMRSTAPFAAAVDSQPRFADVAGATKVRLRDGRVVSVAHELEEFDGLDAGIFVCDAAVADTAERALARGETSWNAVKRRWIAEGGEIAAVDLEGAFWLDVNTPSDARRAERAIVKRAAHKPLDGPVSRFVNRRISWLISLFLLRTGASPNLATALAFTLAVAAAGTVAAGARSSIALVAGGFLVQLASIVDGVDGEIARAAVRKSPLGAFLDSVLDRVADAAILVGLAVAAGLTTAITIALVGALVGSLLVSYLRAGYHSAFGHPPPAAFVRFACSRDVRLLMAAASAVALRPAWGLTAIAVCTSLDVILRTSLIALGARRATTGPAR